MDKKISRYLTGLFIVLTYAGVTALSLTVFPFAYDILVLMLMLGTGLEMAGAVSVKYARPYKQIILVNIIVGYIAFILVNSAMVNSGGITAYFGVLLISIIACVAFTMFGKKHTMHNATSTILVLAYPVSFLVYMLAINYLGSEQCRTAGIFFMFALPCITDTFAFLVGSLFKGPKLCPTISPNKTISGAIGGLLGGLLCGAVLLLFSAQGYFGLGMIAKTTAANAVHYLLIGLMGSFFAQIGDLIASYVKRNCDIKDFGKLLPGHGGMLDRIDSSVVFCVFLFIYLNILSSL